MRNTIEAALVRHSSLDRRRPMATLVVRRSFIVDPDGAATPAGWERGLDRSGTWAELEAASAGTLDDPGALQREGTDLIVRGSAFSLHGPVREMTARVGVAPSMRDALSGSARWTALGVIGDRTAVINASGAIEFSAPTPFESMPLEWTRSFGGEDTLSAERGPTDRFEAELAAQLGGCDLYSYPRNPVGKGYIVDGSAWVGTPVALPNLEDPGDRLTPARLISGDIDRWPRCPVPLCFEAIDPTWFPRTALLGIAPGADVPPDAYAELVAGVVREDQLEPDLFGAGFAKADPRLYDAGHWRLWRGWLPDAAAVVCEGMHPRRERTYARLPRLCPVVDISVGSTVSREVEAQRVAVELDAAEGRMSVTWRARVALADATLVDDRTPAGFTLRWAE